MTRTERADQPVGQPLGGAAAELPPGYIRRGMNDDDAPALGDILAPRRAGTPAAAPAAPPVVADPVHTDPVRTDPVRTEPVVAEPATQPSRRAGTGRRDAVAKAPAPAADARARQVRSNGAKQPVIRPSVVHVPAHLLALVAAERRTSGRSNGEILIAAIEQGHARLTELSDSAETVGGRLFQARAARPRVSDAEPLSPLNVRLYEEDFDVLDRLVAELGVGSRSRLATLALGDYLGGRSANPGPPSPITDRTN